MLTAANTRIQNGHRMQNKRYLHRYLYYVPCGQTAAKWRLLVGKKRFEKILTNKNNALPHCLVVLWMTRQHQN